jgi:hypothetical protein
MIQACLAELASLASLDLANRGKPRSGRIATRCKAICLEEIASAHGQAVAPMRLIEGMEEPDR